MAAAAAAAPWTVRVLLRTVDAEAICEYVRCLLDGAVALVASPMHIADAPGGRARAELVVPSLCDACSCLASVATTTAAAELLALRAAAADPTDPLHSVADLPDAHRTERAALGMLREARVYAERAYNTVGWGCDSLMTAYNLMEHPGLPDVDVFIDGARAAAHHYLVLAGNQARVSAAYTYTAICLLCPEYGDGLAT